MILKKPITGLNHFKGKVRPSQSLNNLKNQNKICSKLKELLERYSQMIILALYGIIAILLNYIQHNKIKSKDKRSYKLLKRIQRLPQHITVK